MSGNVYVHCCPSADLCSTVMGLSWKTLGSKKIALFMGRCAPSPVFPMKRTYLRVICGSSCYNIAWLTSCRLQRTSASTSLILSASSCSRFDHGVLREFSASSPSSSTL